MFATKSSLSTAQGDLENLRLENIYLAKKLDKVTNADLASIFD